MGRAASRSGSSACRAPSLARRSVHRGRKTSGLFAPEPIVRGPGRHASPHPWRCGLPRGLWRPERLSVKGPGLDRDRFEARLSVLPQGVRSRRFNYYCRVCEGSDQAARYAPKLGHHCPQRKSRPKAASGFLIQWAQAASAAVWLRRRYAMKPTPAKPSNIIAHVEGSGIPPSIGAISCEANVQFS